MTFVRFVCMYFLLPNLVVKKRGLMKFRLLIRHCLISNIGYNAKAVKPLCYRASQRVAMSSDAKSIAKRIVWMDLEMTGLDIDKDHILEIACLVTDADLNLVAAGPDIVIHQPDEILKSMNPWCINQHGESGLTEASRRSKITLEQAEKEVLTFVSAHVPENRCPLGGNTIYMDRLFIRKYMPKLNSYLHYRLIDVSTIKELAKRWYQKEYSRIPQKKFTHRSIDDIKESIEELKYYKENIFKS